ncbi:Aste57867_13534 [Aphanomyces stellatus]|uniref:Aste57867_13534 protein n=1 Tax=Aphanomyces stellatus TaxID=120398 RepID=A0A485KZ38_9STRA|nr:hypothetical protein As57867_013484 [Aphanomyces stellatus]VFT90372.1 Aste57867_13534 [Aphanomyces stellatus]
MRDSEALKRKFLLLKNHAKPTADPDCPQDVQRAKRIQRDIDMSVSVLSLDEIDEDDYTNDDASTTPTQPMEGIGDVAGVGRTGLPQSELQALSDSLKRGRDTSNQSAGLLSYTAKKRRSIDKYIEGAADAETKATSDMMTI